MALSAFVLFIAGFVALDKFDKSHNYMRVDARVTEVTATCYLQKKEGNTTRTSDTLDCDRAELLKTIHPAYAGWTVVYSIKVGYLFTSPVDRQAHEGQLTLAAYPEGRRLQYGDVMPVLAHKAEAAKSRAI